MTRCAPFAAANAWSNGSFVSTRMLSASVAAAGAEEQDDRKDRGLEPSPTKVGDGLGRYRSHHATIRAVRSPPIAPSTRWTMRCARALRQLLVMGHQHDRLAPAIEVLEQRQRVLAISSVERAGRFVGQQDGRSVHDRAGDRDALPLAAAERGREVPRLVGQAELAEQRIDVLRASRRALVPASRAATAMLSAHAQVIEQVEELEDEPDVGPPEPRRAGLAETVDPDAGDLDLALGRAVEAADQVEQRRLAAARRTHDRGDPAGLDVEVDVVERGLRWSRRSAW